MICQIVGCNKEAEHIQTPIFTSGMYCRVHFNEIDTGETSKFCKDWYEEKKECTKITNILQDNDILNFIGTMNGQKRSCLGQTFGCLFLKGQGE